jgi:hypothetical protein
MPMWSLSVIRSPVLVIPVVNPFNFFIFFRFWFYYHTCCQCFILSNVLSCNLWPMCISLFMPLLDYSALNFIFLGIPCFFWQEIFKSAFVSAFCPFANNNHTKWNDSSHFRTPPPPPLFWKNTHFFLSIKVECSLFCNSKAVVSESLLACYVSRVIYNFVSLSVVVLRHRLKVSNWCCILFLYI